MAVEPGRETAETQNEPVNRLANGVTWHEVRQSSRPGDRYIKLAAPGTDKFRRVAPDRYLVGDAALVPSGSDRYIRALKSALIGRPIRSEMAAHERLTKVSALAVLSSDALSSVAYCTEAALFVLAYAVTAGAMDLIVPIMGAIAVLIVIVALSYRQTIHAYPNGGGSYIVAKDNLGTNAGLIAASALMIDYVLTVSVSIVSGVQNFTSIPVFDFLNNDTAWLWISVGLIVLLAVINLRGIRESGTIFTLPTYFFIGAFVLLIGYGAFQFVTGNIHALPNDPAYKDVPHFHTENLGIFLVLQAFAAGCSAMTGIEAISNGVPAFKKPESRNAATTLTWMAAILIFLVLGITLLMKAYEIQPRNDETAISQLAHALFDNSWFSWFYYVVQISTSLILILAANTSYADFPRLASLLARDKFLPHIFAHRGDRLAFSTGIIALSLFAIALIAAIGASTQALIPLYAIGVFLAFTLSQSGMVLHWQKHTEESSRRRSQLFNGLGAIATGVVLVIIASTKFLEGAWLVVLLIPLFFLLFKAISIHYRNVADQLRLPKDGFLDHASLPKPDVLVPVGDLNKATLLALDFARSLSTKVTAIHVADDSEAIARLQAKWRQWEVNVPLVVLESPYRSISGPLLAYIDTLHQRAPKDTMLVVLPEFVALHWWEVLLHNLTALRLKWKLLPLRGIAVLSVPYHLSR